MEKGKRICRTLKELRKRIADANEIPFEIEECPHKGDCSGTCPKCEAELHYLMNAIDKREKQGKPVFVENLMTEDELRKTFGVEPITAEHPSLETAGMPAPLDPSSFLMGILVPPLMSSTTIMPTYEFASTIVKELQAEMKGNFIFSPAGLCRVLEMLQDGMNRKSKIYQRMNELISSFNSEIVPCDVHDFNLEHATSIWYNKALDFVKKGYLKVLNRRYGSKAHNADFHNEAKTKLWIDKWVSDNTHHKIKRLDAPLSKDALIVILDAIYMSGKWENPFDPWATECDTFYNSDKTMSEVEMMFQEIEDAEYGETDDYQVINLPYRNSEYSMTVVLPKDGKNLDDIMANPEWLDYEMDDCNVDLYMPRFAFDTTITFNEILIKLGLSDMFNKEDSLPNITDWPAHISLVMQQCVIDVEEEGTEAAAVTVAECVVGCLPPDDIVQNRTMRLDRPFGFAIKNTDRLLLFMGAVKNLKES